ncbi:peptidoglycan DD-metalloendopeptidase family protein [Patescibacteria group bacterium]|nr:peptidoglycan DD-metalloendopeptidase family protein [Patescibacteria group bacterium]
MKLKSASTVLSIRFHRIAPLCIVALLVLGALFTLPTNTLAETAEEIAARIATQNAKIAQLEKEIAEYERQLVVIGSAKSTLESEVKRIDVSRKKIGTDISVTENRITEASLEIKELGGEISQKEKSINAGKEAVNLAFQNIYKIGETTLVEHLLTANGLENAWTTADRERIVQEKLRAQIDNLLDTKQELTLDLTETQKKQNQLKNLKRELANQKLVLDQNRKEQANLLADTKNKESEFQTLLAEKQAAKLEFEKQLGDYEAALQFNLDPTSIPKAGSGVLSFPVDSAFMAKCKDRYSTFKNNYCITQYYGNTSFAQSGAYNGKDHNGIDFGTPTGTKIVSALPGEVTATGNTDAYKGCYSYGKWVLVKHTNGLSTLYAHLSVISVTKGEAVSRGGLIGYSGKTGYATGPHLHFTLYVSDAVKVVRYGDVKAKTNCANATIPVAPTDAYLDPLKYL